MGWAMIKALDLQKLDLELEFQQIFFIKDVDIL